jgi:hypothetical protein
MHALQRSADAVSPVSLAPIRILMSNFTRGPIEIVEGNYCISEGMNAISACLTEEPISLQCNCQVPFDVYTLTLIAEGGCELIEPQTVSSLHKEVEPSVKCSLPKMILITPTNMTYQFLLYR